jgi:D-3-phosphoglycerate dehydrogenase
MIDSPRRWREPLSRALVIEEPHPDLDARLSSLGIAVERLSETPDEASLARILREGQHDLLFKRSAVAVTEEVVQASKRLAAVLLCCIGDDSVDKEACAQHGVMVMNDPVSNGRSVAEMVIGEMVTLSRRVFDSVSETAQSRWYKNSTQRFEVRGKRVGVLGLGKIGRQVAQLAEGLGAQILFFDSSPIAQEIGTTLGWSRVESIDELFRAADIVTVHVSATDHHGKSNAGLISRDNLREMGNKEHGSPASSSTSLADFFTIPKTCVRRSKTIESPTPWWMSFPTSRVRATRSGPIPTPTSLASSRHRTLAPRPKKPNPVSHATSRARPSCSAFTGPCATACSFHGSSSR